MIEIKLGKIENIKFGYGGYQDVQFGLSVTLSGEAWGVGSFTGDWSIDMECNERCEWTEQKRNDNLAQMCKYINKLLKQAKKTTIDELKNVPVEVTLESNTLKDWRILEEVL